MQIETMLDEVLSSMNRSFVALMKVIYGGHEPLAALEAMKEALPKAADGTDEAKGVIH